jgi:hypothetical protein
MGTVFIRQSVLTQPTLIKEISMYIRLCHQQHMLLRLFGQQNAPHRVIRLEWWKTILQLVDG